MTIADWIQSNSVWIVFGVTIVVLVYYIYKTTEIFMSKKRRRTIRHPITALTLILTVWGLLFLIYIVFMGGKIQVDDWAQVILLGGLVSITAAYAYSTEKMAEEMRKDRLLTSRPVIVIGPVHEPAGVSADYSRSYFSHFELCNEGSGPAINLEICVLNLNKGKNCLDEKTVPFLRARDTMKFSPDIPLVNQAGSTCYLLCRYRSVLSKSTEPPLYRTGLPFEIEKSSRGQDKVIVRPGELLFGDEAEAFLEKS